MAGDPGTVKRAYQSPLRQAQAQATRQQVIAAAGRLFAEQGYAATSVDAVASAAGVSRATVFASVGGKPALLKAAYDVAVVGDDEPVSLPERPWAQRVRAETDARRMLTLYAEMLTEVSGRVAPIYEAVRGAASADPDVRALWEWIQEERRKGSGTFIGFVAALGSLRPDLNEDEAADVVWVLNDPGLYHQLVRRQGWTRGRFRHWLAATLHDQLLPSAGGGD